MHRIALVAVLLGLCAAVARPAGARTVVIYGYPLATRCPAAGIAEAVDRWGMFAWNCTNVARRAHIAVGRAPRVGAVAVWPKLVPPFGHLAYVMGVERGGTIDVAEYNFDADTPEEFAFDTRTDVAPA